jgi:hypothetical protein
VAESAQRSSAVHEVQQNTAHRSLTLLECFVYGAKAEHYAI